ncbi:MAG: hypothetical protein LBM98_13395 [Oscillospiraceae bacterium]|jgi:hypothetical protein|nr:hypothetical protein [Oscillospiraceae bacterium]
MENVRPRYRRATVDITRAAVLLALLIVWQYVTAPLKLTLLTGSGVNFLLIICVLTSGTAPGLCMALISPVLAKLLNIGPMWELIPFIALGNVTLALVWRLIAGEARAVRAVWKPFVAAILGALVKFAVLFFGIVKIAVPLVLKLPEPQAGAISGTFSVPQLFSALIGGALAIAALPLLKILLKGRST